MRVWTWMLLMGVGCGPSQAEVDNLERRVNALERRLRAVEGGEPPKARRGGRKRGAAAPARPAPVPSGPVRIDVLGDAKQVLLGARERTIPIPGQVPPGTYAVLASFADGEEPGKAGSVEITGPGPVTVTCATATRRCLAEH